MTSDQQEKLFKLVQRRFKNWTARKASGYVHGVADGLGSDDPRKVYLQGYEDDEPYAAGYMYGFIDARGSDTIGKWCLKLAHIPVEYRWWTNAIK